MSALCPSYECLPGANLIGIAAKDGFIRFIDPIRVDKKFVDSARSCKTPPEDRFRFSGGCVETFCKQWTGSACRLASMLESDASVDDVKPDQLTNLSNCSIKAKCRWHLQEGSSICHSCSLVTRGYKPECSSHVSDKNLK